MDSNLTNLAELPGAYSLFLVFFLVVLNGFFVAVEFALVRCHPTKLKDPEFKDSFGIKSSFRLIEELDFSLSACQLGVTIASLLLGWWGEVTCSKVVIYLISLFRPDLLNQSATMLYVHGVSTAIALFIVTFMHVVIGEMMFKTLAIRYPESVVRVLAPFMLLFSNFFRPFIALLNWCSNALLSLFGVKGSSESERAHSVGEIEMLISHSTEKGLLDKEEQEMLQGIFGFSETVAREIMTPRTDLVYVDLKDSFDVVVQRVMESGLSRFPVVEGNTDKVVGILLARDLLKAFRERENYRSFNLRSVMREPFFIPGTKPIDDLLSEFKVRSAHMAMVLDEHGGVDGVVTLEDIIEEIVGEIYDESDEAETSIKVMDNGDVVVDGGVLVADINERFEVKIPEGDYDTIAGFVMTTLGRVPEAGEMVVYSPKQGEVVQEGAADLDKRAALDDSDDIGDNEKRKLLFTIEKINGHRIETVRLHSVGSGELQTSID